MHRDPQFVRQGQICLSTEGATSFPTPIGNLLYQKPPESAAIAKPPIPLDYTP